MSYLTIVCALLLIHLKNSIQFDLKRNGSTLNATNFNELRSTLKPISLKASLKFSNEFNNNGNSTKRPPIDHQSSSPQTTFKLIYGSISPHQNNQTIKLLNRLIDKFVNLKNQSTNFSSHHLKLNQTKMKQLFERQSTNRTDQLEELFIKNHSINSNALNSTLNLDFRPSQKNANLKSVLKKSRLAQQNQQPNTQNNSTQTTDYLQNPLNALLPSCTLLDLFCWIYRYSRFLFVFRY